MVVCDKCGSPFDFSGRSHEDIAHLLQAMDGRLRELAGKRPLNPKPRDPDAPLPTCSFCGKAQDEVDALVAGPDVYICDMCIELCSEIMAEKKR